MPSIPLSIFLSTLVPPGATLSDLLDAVVTVEKHGFAGAWASEGVGYDPIAALTLAGPRTSRLALGTAVVRTWPRHPVAVAQQAQVANVACGGRFRLGVGPGHESMMAAQFGMSVDRPVSHMREYVTIARALLHDGAVDVDGDRYRAHATLRAEGLGTPVLMSALSERMCRLAGRVSDGVVVWLAPPSYVASTVVPMVRAGAARAGRVPPPIVVGAPATVSSDTAAVRDTVRDSFAVYTGLPFYVSMFRKAGIRDADRAAEAGWSDAMVDAVVPHGGEVALAERVEAYRAAGADEVVLAPFGVGSTAASDTLSALADVNRTFGT